MGQTPCEGIAQDRLRLHARSLRGNPDGHDPGPRRRRTQLPVPLAADDLRGGRRGVPQRTRDGHAADRLLVRGTGPRRRRARHGHPLVRRGRRRHFVPHADLLLGAGGPRVLPRGERLDARILAHVGLLALQPRDELRLHALRHDRGRYPQGDRRLGERTARGGPRSGRPGRGVRDGGRTPALPHALQRREGPGAVRPLVEARPLPHGQIHGRQREERARRRAGVPRQRRPDGPALRGERQRPADSRQDPVPGLQREVEARRGGRQRQDTDSGKRISVL